MARVALLRARARDYYGESRVAVMSRSGAVPARRRGRARIFRGKPEVHYLTVLDEAERPRKRGDCVGGGGNAERPCPWVSCKYHLLLDVSIDTGSVRINYDNEPVRDPVDTLLAMPETCALDVADRGGQTQHDIAALLGVTHQAVNWIELKARESARARTPREEVEEFFDHPHHELDVLDGGGDALVDITHELQRRKLIRKTADPRNGR